MASAMRVDADDEAEDQFEMPLEDLSDPVQSVEPPQTTYHAVAGRERERERKVRDRDSGWKKSLRGLQVVTGTVPDQESDVQPRARWAKAIRQRTQRKED